MVLNNTISQEAVNWLSSRPYVDANGIGVIGVSKGGEIALQMAYYIPKVSDGKFCSTFNLLMDNI